MIIRVFPLLDASLFSTFNGRDSSRMKQNYIPIGLVIILMKYLKNDGHRLTDPSI